jgi:ATP-dependent Clp protease ATP-binding subunit ClpB
LCHAVKIQLEKYSKALEERKIAVDLDDSAATQLVRTAFNPTMGARPVKRLLERVVMTSLSRLVSWLVSTLDFLSVLLQIFHAF